MALVVYVGPFEAVEIEHQAGDPWAGVAFRGTPVEVPAHVAASLLEQPSNWAAPTKSKPKGGDQAVEESEQ